MLKMFESGNAIEISEIVAIRIVPDYGNKFFVAVETPTDSFRATESSDEEKTIKDFNAIVSELNRDVRLFMPIYNEYALKIYFNIREIRAVFIDADDDFDEENNPTTIFKVYVDVKGSGDARKYPVGYFYDDLYRAKMFVQNIVREINQRRYWGMG